MADLNRLLQRLLDRKFEFVLVGGFAGVLHGASQVTRDIDICMALDPSIIGQLRSELADLHPVHRQTPQKLSFLDHPTGLATVRNLYLQTDLGPLDILSEIIGVGPFDVVASGATTIFLYGMKCLVIGLDDLIASKEALGRDRDRLAVTELRAIRDKIQKS
ncbi:MAG: nucleotidyltransferase [Pseudomonadota bacterium]